MHAPTHAHTLTYTPTPHPLAQTHQHTLPGLPAAPAEVTSQRRVTSALVMWTQLGGAPAFSSDCSSDRQMSRQTQTGQADRESRK